MQFRGDDPNTDIAGFNGELALPSADPDERGVVLDSKDSLSKSADSDFSPTKPSRLSQPSSVSPRGFGAVQGEPTSILRPLNRSSHLRSTSVLSSLPSFVFLLFSFTLFLLRYQIHSHSINTA